MSEGVWVLPPALDRSAVQRLETDLRLPRFVAELLVRRGISGDENIERFLDPRLKSLSDPFQLPDMERAVDRLLAAIDRSERIVLYGDYDVDGVTSLALLTRLLRAYGAEVATFLPHRVDEGYGLSADGVARCIEELRPGQMSVDGPDKAGQFAVVQKLETIPGRQLSYEEASGFIDDSMQNKESERLLKALVARHKKKYPIMSRPDLVMRIKLVDPTL